MIVVRKLVTSFVIFVFVIFQGFPQGQGAELLQRAEAGQRTIVVSDLSAITDPTQPIVLRASDGQNEEAYYIYAFDDNRVTLTAALRQSFDANAIVAPNAGALNPVGPIEGVSAGASGWLVSTDEGRRADVGLIVTITAVALAGLAGVVAAARD